MFYNINNNDVGRLQKLINRAMRIILKESRRASVREMKMKLNFLDIKRKIELNVFVFIHKIMLGLAPQYLSNKIKLVDSIHNHNTRNRNNIFVKSTKLNTILTKGTSDYNKLSKKIRDSKTVSNFKTKLYAKFIEDEETNIM